ncbi:MAG: type IV toxin-antitoxin system AbiEi family antitoxin [Verrucomicrobiota bacterium]|jgi:DNA-binding MarR family transcriptional regulator
MVKLLYLDNMNSSWSHRFESEIPKRLAELLAVPLNSVKVHLSPAADHGSLAEVDMVVESGDFRFAVEWKASGEAATVTMAARRAKAFAHGFKRKSIPLVAVPFMGEVGRRLCEEAGVCWLDLSGNAHLVAPGLRVSVEGKPNQFIRPGRPRSVFAPKSARIARWLLVEPDRAFSQRELAKVSGLDEGFTSRIVRQLEEQQLVSRDSGGAVKVSDFDTLLDAWREVYDFSKHHVVRGHIAARSSDDVLRRLSAQLKRGKAEHAVTGLAGAWLCSGFAGFRLVAVYVAELPGQEAREAMGFHEVENGENIWLVRPNDAGVFQGGSEREGIACAHPVQIYLDLKRHPERSVEAAEELRKKLLKPSHA